MGGLDLTKIPMDLIMNIINIVILFVIVFVAVIGFGRFNGVGDNNR